MNEKARNLLLTLSLTIVMISAALPIFMVQWTVTPYLFAVGAAGTTIARLTRNYTGKNFRLKRLYRIELFSSFALLIASFFLFRGERDWIMFLTVTAVLQLYTAFLIPKVEKEKN